MIRSAVTISLVPEARGGPFVFWDTLPAACHKAAKIGFDAVEIFAPSPDAIDKLTLSQQLEELNLEVAAVGTGAGMVVHGLSLTDPNAEQRTKAKAFIQKIIDFGAELRAPAIIGSMQGKWGGDLDHARALEMLSEALTALGTHAAERGVPLIYEPLNRYETNLVNTIADGVNLLKSLSTDNVKLLADLFHMNIEETSLPEAILAGEGFIGHVHFVDSNRRPAGCGHIDLAPVASALHKIAYDRYASAEAFPYPDSDAAAQQTIETFRRFFPR